MSRPGGSRIEFRYDRAGRKIATLTPLGRETLFERDENGQVIGQVTPDGQRWTMERDALGNTVRIEGPEHQRWQITRNKRGQQLEITGPEGTTAFAYDDERLPDRPTTVTDAVGATHQREWNARAALPDATPITSITPRSPTAWAVKSCITSWAAAPASAGLPTPALTARASNSATTALGVKWPPSTRWAARRRSSVTRTAR